ncbi:DUF4214 domain-containing protein [Massilia endophytica]|uniref:DUF4214 domain-containing protein n=1 Tax=Massilia endophytica TaxID=2899220 RepID=UPI001E2B23DD|nr:DUF4214 domain-containing protein [Massilia endophytica]UGQ44632.1 DUF4214 domain-containing protein [Massilia endophytica]
MNSNRLTLIKGQVLAADTTPAISGNGQLVAFTTSQSLLASDTTPGDDDIYIKNLLTGTLEQVTLNAGVAVGGTNSRPELSLDGGFVAFENVQVGGLRTVMVRDMAGGGVTEASTDASGVAANAASHSASLSSNGQFVAFLSAADNLTAGDTNTLVDGYLKDIGTGAIINVSTKADGTLANRATNGIMVSGDGNSVVFSCGATNLGAEEQSALERIYIKKVASGALSLVSATALGEMANAISYHPAVSENGRYVVFTSSATNLSSDAVAGVSSIYRKDMQSGAIMLVSTDAQGASGSGNSDNAMISADGRYVMFESTSNLTPGDGDGKLDVFIKDLVTGAITRMSTGSAAGTNIESGSFARSSLDTVFISKLGAGATGVDVIHGALGAGFNSVANTLYTGDAGKNTLVGAAGNDTFKGNGGNDLIDGGPGMDEAYYSGNLSSYTIKKTAAGLVVTDVRGIDGIDTLGNVETLRFADLNLSFDTKGIPGQVYRLYQAAFDRVPDQPGLGHWIELMQEGMELREVARQFFGSTEAQARYGVNPSNETLVEAMYANVLHRAPEPAGFSHWLARLQEGLTTADMLVSFSESAENQAALVGVMQNGFAYTPF